MSFTVFLDLDGVIVDFDSRVNEILGTTEWDRADVGGVMSTPNFFRNLDPFPGAIAQVESILEMVPGQVRILSAVPRNHPELAAPCREQKFQWLWEHIPDLAESALIVSDKGKVGTENDILIDDHPDWNGADEFPGLVIPYTDTEDWDVLRNAIQKKLDSVSDTEKVARLIVFKGQDL